jgi:thymidylate kinase
VTDNESSHEFYCCAESEAKQNFFYEKIELKRPTIISFVGIPGSGKSTITKRLGNILNICAYLEPEESEYPEDIKKKFLRIKETGAALEVYKHFRDIRVKNLLSAEKTKNEGKSSVIDCFYDKIMIDILGKSETDYFVDSKGDDFEKILKIAKEDSLSLPRVDFLFFLRLNDKELHDHFLKERGRKLDVSSEIYQAQEVFLRASKDCSQRNQTIFVVINQSRSIETIIQQIIFFLEKEKIIKLPEFSRVAIQNVDSPGCFLLVNNKKGG